MEERPSFGALPPSQLENARVVLHHAVLLVAAVGKDLLPTRDDASHKALVYEPRLRAFASPAEDVLPVRVALRVHDLTLRLLDAQRGDEDHVALVGRTLDQVESWLNDRIQDRWPEVPARASRERYDDLPAHVVGDGGAVPEVDPAPLRELERYYALTRTLLEEVQGEYPRAAPIRIWPHHFDEAVLLPVGASGSTAARTVGVGLSPGDGHRAEPYWYVTPWPYPSADGLPVDPPLGSWHAEPFFGATLEASRVLDGEAPPEDTVRRFLATAISTAEDLLRD